MARSGEAVARSGAPESCTLFPPRTTERAPQTDAMTGVDGLPH